MELTSIKRFSLYLLLFLFILSCEEDDDQEFFAPTAVNIAQIDDTLILNPSGYSPLSARLIRNYPVAVNLEIWIKDINSGAFELLKRYSRYERRFDIPILGLFPNHKNILKISAINAQQKVVTEEDFEIETSPLPIGMPEIIIKKDLGNLKSSGMNLLSYWGIRNPQMPLIFDEDGRIRWYLDYRNHPELASLSYDNGLERLYNGNFYFGDKSSDKIYEVDMYGEVINSWFLPGHEFHHNVSERSNGNFLVTTTKIGDTHDNGIAVVEDWVIEIARSNGMIIREWDLKESLDEYRTSWRDDLVNPPIDWFHGNAVIEGKDQNSMIASGRTQGIVKFNMSNQPLWILSTHNGWGVNRDSVDLNQFLLQPLDAASTPILDTNVLNGHTNHPDFEWAWYPHAPEYLPNGDLLIFDNGDNRNYSPSQEYSRAVIFRIDEQNRTIQQIWTYGKSRGKETYGQYVSDVDYLADKDNILFSPGFGTENDGKIGGRIVEIDYTSKQVVFEAIINNPPGSFVCFHRAERLSLYP